LCRKVLIISRDSFKRVASVKLKDLKVLRYGTSAELYVKKKKQKKTLRKPKRNLKVLKIDR
jgi:hypothetical protein